MPDGRMVPGERVDEPVGRLVAGVRTVQRVSGAPVGREENGNTLFRLEPDTD